MKSALVLGAGGFIGSHMVKRLKLEGYFVRGVDLKYPEFSKSDADEFIIADLRDHTNMWNVVQTENKHFEEIYQFAADMGGAGFVFTGDHDAEIMHNSATINLNLLDCLVKLNKATGKNISKVLYSGSACMYPSFNQEDPDNPNCEESSAYPAQPDSEYGWEKLFSERLYLSFHRNFNIQVRVARYHNIFGPEGTWNGGREKAPAAICRKVAYAEENGLQTRSFLYIDECIEATRELMLQNNFIGPVNIGSEEMVTINKLVTIVSEVSKKKVSIKHIEGPTGVRGRNSSNKLIREKLGWNYRMTLKQGLESTYDWILLQIEAENVK